MNGLDDKLIQDGRRSARAEIEAGELELPEGRTLGRVGGPQDATLPHRYATGFLAQPIRRARGGHVWSSLEVVDEAPRLHEALEQPALVTRNRVVDDALRVDADLEIMTERPPMGLYIEGSG